MKSMPSIHIITSLNMIPTEVHNAIPTDVPTKELYHRLWKDWSYLPAPKTKT